MALFLKRAYDKPSPADGYRVLVDRLWPRGVSKQEAKLDEWLREIAPSEALRKEFHHDRARWGEFRKRYLSELRSHREDLRPLARRAGSESVTLVYAGRDEARNNAVVLREYLEMLSGR